VKSDSFLWWQQGIIYQIYPRSFQDSNNDGIGDLPGIIEHLDYLVWLGVDAIWLSPFYPSPMADFGYDIADYRNVDPIFGTLKQFDTLVAQAHERNLKVLIDFVPNHTSDEHPWFQESRSSRDNPKRNWYVWVDAKPAGTPPNNWLSIMGEPVWEWDETTGQYYLHTFLKKQPDLNWRNPEVKAAMFDIVRFWLERGVDGFRVDAAHFIMKDPQLRDNPTNPSLTPTLFRPQGAYDSLIHLYDKDHADTHEVYRELRRVLDEYSTTQPRVMIGEMHILDRQKWSSYYGNLDEFHMPFNFWLLNAPWNAHSIQQAVNDLEASLPTDAWPNNVLSNHDEPRLGTRIGPEMVPLAMLLLLTLRGTPTLYYGDEIGMHNGEIPEDRICDPVGKNVPGLGLGRDPERTPMQWNTQPNAGFCSAETEPWLPLPEDYQQNNVASERANAHSLLTLTHRIIQLRRSTPALASGSYRSLANVPTDCFVYLREADQQRYIVALNFTEQEQQIQLSTPASGHFVLSTYLDREEPVTLSHFMLRPHEGVIIQVKGH
jgi:Glycosidases